LISSGLVGYKPTSTPDKGPFKSRKEAEDCWKEVSEESRHKAGVRYTIVEEPDRSAGA
jgi:hypothetical protein